MFLIYEWFITCSVILYFFPLYKTPPLDCNVSHFWCSFGYRLSVMSIFVDIWMNLLIKYLVRTCLFLKTYKSSQLAVQSRSLQWPIDPMCSVLTFSLYPSSITYSLTSHQAHGPPAIFKYMNPLPLGRLCAWLASPLPQATQL